MKKIKEFFAAYSKFISLVFLLRKKYLFVAIGLGLVNGMSTLILVFIPKILIDLVSGDVIINNGIFLFLGIFLIKLVLGILEDILTQLANNEARHLNSRLNIFISEKVTKIKYHYLESKEILELKEKIKGITQYGALNLVLDIFKAVVRDFITLFGIVVILINFSLPIFLIITVLSILGILVNSIVASKAIVFQKGIMGQNTKFNYYFEKLDGEEFYKDHKLYGLNKLIIKKVSRFVESIGIEIGNIQKLQAQGRILADSINIVGQVILYIYVGLRVLGLGGRKISLGNFSLIISSAESYKNTLIKFFNNLTQLIVNLPMITPIFEFLDLEEEENKGAEISEEFKSLEFKNVEFSYPGSDRKILNGISFKINKGEKIALVGINNAGKSTIVKLICGLFQPTSGEILYNGTNIKDLNYIDYNKNLSTVFQDFKLFPISIKDNITSNIDNNTVNEVEVLNILDKLNMKEAVLGLEKGLDTNLFKSINEDATDFSKGQLQKLAIGRCVYKKAELNILDEPTAALDPLAEAEIYGHFYDLIKDKTAIFISHRMSASRLCDRIIVLENGKISGVGNHKDLVETNKLYSNLYSSQAKYYN